MKEQRKAPSGPIVAGDAAAWPPPIPVLIVLVTLAVFLPSLRNGFVNWDDGKTIVENPYYRGLDWSHLRWMFTTFHMGHYMPLTWLTLGSDYVLWGMNPFGYHLTSVLLHAANGALFFFVARRLLAAGTGRAESSQAVQAGALFSALVFALHPLRVESVVWATERRDVLSGFFYLATVLAYLRAEETRERYGKWYWISLGLFLCALLSKEMAATLPAVLLIIDVYPLRRLGGATGWRGRGAWPVYIEKVPFLVLSAAASVVAFLAISRLENMASLTRLGLVARAASSAYALGFYLWKSIAPFDLSPLYELPGELRLLSLPFLLGYALVIALTAASALLYTRLPGLAAAWAAFVVTLLPVLPIFQNGPQIVANRYTYLAALGWAVLAGAALLACWKGPARGRADYRQFVSGLAAALLFVSGFLTWGQTEIWHDSERLWRYALAHDEAASFGHNNLGIALSAEGKLDEAVAHFRTGLQLDPKDADLWYNLGNALARQGRLEGAIGSLQQALQLRPGYADAEYDLGNIYAAQGRPDEAASHFRAALGIDPAYVKAHNNLGVILAAQGKLDEAVGHFHEALRIEPGYAPAHENLAKALSRQGKKEEALRHYQEALRIMKPASDPESKP